MYGYNAGHIKVPQAAEELKPTLPKNVRLLLFLRFASPFCSRGPSGQARGRLFGCYGILAFLHRARQTAH